MEIKLVDFIGCILGVIVGSSYLVNIYLFFMLTTIIVISFLYLGFHDKNTITKLKKKIFYIIINAFFASFGFIIGLAISNI